MHAGSITKNTAAGRVYAHLKAHIGEWFTTRGLAAWADTYCVSTRISEVRAQLDDGLEIITEPFSVKGRRVFRYRMVKRGKK